MNNESIPKEQGVETFGLDKFTKIGFSQNYIESHKADIVNLQETGIQEYPRLAQNLVFRAFIDFAPTVGLAGEYTVYIDKNDPKSTLQHRTLASDGTPVVFNVAATENSVFSLVKAPEGIGMYGHVFNEIDTNLHEVGINTPTVYMDGDKLYVRIAQEPGIPHDPQGPRDMSAAAEAEYPWFYKLKKGSKIFGPQTEFIFVEIEDGKYVVYDIAKESMVKISTVDFEEGCQNQLYKFGGDPEDISMINQLPTETWTEGVKKSRVREE